LEINFLSELEEEKMFKVRFAGHNGKTRKFGLAPTKKKKKKAGRKK